MNELRLPAAGEFALLKKNYLFTEVRRKTAAFLEENGGEVINLGVGDVAYPLPPAVTEALASASLEMGDNVRFKGYPPEGGYPFLRRAIVSYYEGLGVKIKEEEVFVGDGAKTDVSSFAEVFGRTEALVTDPVYPVYADSSVLLGNAVKFLRGNKSNGFLPPPPRGDDKPRIIYLCSPNNPSGGAYDRAGLKEWVDYALSTGSVIFFDAAYSAFAGEGIPRSVFETDGAKECCVEFCSFSKFAGFTNLRCSWVTVPEELKCRKTQVIALWRRRQSTKFNGVSYPVQRAAEAALSPEGRRECEKTVSIYKSNAERISAFLGSRGVWHCGGKNSPYIWLECPERLSSEEFFDGLLNNCRIVGTPGNGFGSAGEGFFRLSCFAREEVVAEALERLGDCPYFR
ncbi:MAG: LL-diaminopimelate aminotransferase [Clostridia bacterium]|nr:LL-diaminopimelate aminotransferase [Clostridia bacterium]